MRTCDEVYYENGKRITYHRDGRIISSAYSKRSNKIYRHNDAERVNQILAEQQIVIVEAEMGAGKTSILRSISGGYEAEEVIFINGHDFGENKMPVPDLVELFTKRHRDTRLLIIDNADYLFQRKKYIRSGNSGYIERCKQLIATIKAFIQSNPSIKVVLTIHDINWRKIKADHELYRLFKEAFNVGVSLTLSDDIEDTSIVRYLIHEEGLSSEEAWFVAEMYKNEYAQNILNQLGYLKNARSMLSSNSLLRKPRIISQIFKKYPSLKARLKDIFGINAEKALAEESWISEYVNAAISVDYQGIFLPIITAVRGKRRAAIWGTIECLDN